MPIYNRQTTISLTMSGTSGVTGRTYEVNHLAGIGATPDETTNYYDPDHLGSERMMTGVNGYPVWQATYLPYGYEFSPEMGVNRFKFTDYQRDSESGLDYAKFRYYSSTIGRFMTPDPLDGDPGNPQSWNRYAYVLNNPANFVDPLGLECSWNGEYVICDWAAPDCFFCDSRPYPPRESPSRELRDPAPHISGHKPKPLALKLPTNGKSCVGRARVLEGNPTTTFSQGAVPGRVVSLNSAAAIPQQFGFSSGADFATLEVSGTTGVPITGLRANFFFADVNMKTSGKTQQFYRVRDVIGGTSPIPGMNVRAALMKLNPGALIIELVNGSDQGTTTIQLSLPAGQPCPAGTLDQSLVSGSGGFGG